MHGVVVNIFLYASSILQFLCNNMLDAIQSSGMVWLFLLWMLHSLFSCPSVRPLVMYEQTLPTTPFISNLEHTYLALHMLSVVMFALMWDPTPRVAVFNPFICLFGLHVCHSYICTPWGQKMHSGVCLHIQFYGGKNLVIFIFEIKFQSFVSVHDRFFARNNMELWVPKKLS